MPRETAVAALHPRRLFGVVGSQVGDADADLRGPSSSATRGLLPRTRLLQQKHRGQGPRSAARRKRRARLAELRRARITGAVTLSRTTSERGGQEVLRRISANEPFSRGRRAVPKLAMRS